VTQTSATVSGTANDNGSDTTCSFGYGTDNLFDSKTPTVSFPTGSGSAALSANLTALRPGSTYDYRLECANAGGATLGSSLSFTTLPDAPTTVTSAPSSLTSNSATLNGTVARNGGTTSCVFNYGTATDYGAQAGLQHITANGVTPVSTPVTGLTVGTRYHYRLECTNEQGSTTGSDVSFTPPSGITKVLWIMEENRSETQLMSDPYVPYLRSLANNYGLLANLHNEIDPSEGNYFALLAGSTYGVADDALPAKHPLTGPTIFSQLPAGQAMAFSETMPSNCYAKGSLATDINHDGSYAVHHSGWPYFVDANERALCQQYHVNLQANLQAKIDSGLPAFTEVAPADCNEMHRGSVPNVASGCNFDAVTGPNLYSRADWWMSTWLPKIMAGRDYQAGNLAIMIVWDEGAGPGDVAGMDCTNSTIEACHPPAIVISPYTQRVVSSTHYTHYDVLRTTEELLGISTYLGNAATASSFASDFGLFSGCGGTACGTPAP
ncbi:MAG: alkaline phosphatase family protein, partial [Actinomycetota bacterium]|nr:alkaline phosphatase family protein [Actinomycetota bacterium]